LATADTGVSRALGIDQATAITASAASMTGVSGLAQWPSAMSVRPLQGKALHVLARTATSTSGNSGVLMAMRTIGSGRVVAFAVDPLAYNREGYELLPRAAALVGSELGASAGPQMQGAEVFVDPGSLSSTLRKNPALIADLLVQTGARIAEIAADDYDFTDSAGDYNYAALISALHARGILAYAWLEPPFVTLALWQKHPECREITESGRDAFVGWRRLIALEDPKCFVLATDSWHQILTGYDWDGVNFAELYFQPASSGPQNYTPFSASALSQFGANPKTHPAAFAAFRTKLVTELNKEVLGFANSLPTASHLAFELTVIDNTLDPAAGNAVGSDVVKLAGVARSEGASLIVEDPASTWADGPLRYDTLGPRVQSLMPPDDALIDVNVVNRTGYSPKPTLAMIGSELDLALDSATAPLGRVGIYALGTLSAQDRTEIAGAMGASTVTTDLGVYSRWTVKVFAPTSSDDLLTMDGIPWPAASGYAIVPAGNDILVWSQGASAGPALLAFTGQLGAASVMEHSMTFRYLASPDALAVVSQRATSIKVDGKHASLHLQKDPAGGWVVRIPEGSHRVTIDF
jgi:hypothetical protein